MSLSTSQIDKALQKVPGYCGAHPFDRISHIVNTTKPTYIVINTGKYGTVGEHWIGLVMLPNECMYFDSFGVKIINRQITELLVNSGYKYCKYSDNVLQSINSEMCGYYVIAFISAISNGISYNKFLNLFSQCKNNDIKTIDIIKKYLK